MKIQQNIQIRLNFQDHYSMQKEKYRVRLSARYKKQFFFLDGTKYYIFVLKRLAAPCMV